MTEGSRFLEELILDDDPRTLYIQTWGGTNTTARALKSIQEGASLTVHIPDDAKSDDTFHIITEVQNVTETPFKTYVRRILTVK